MHIYKIEVKYRGIPPRFEAKMALSLPPLCRKHATAEFVLFCFSSLHAKVFSVSICFVLQTSWSPFEVRQTRQSCQLTAASGTNFRREANVHEMSCCWLRFSTIFRA